MGAVRRNAIRQTVYQRMRPNGKSTKCALTAVTRKLVILINRLLKNPDFNLVC